MDLRQKIFDVFLPDGALANAAEHFLPRAGQTSMALAVARTIEHGGALVVEAGTGVGKTFAYLVPALLSGERVLLSTATKTLQDQLFGRDLPRLVQALGLPVRMALLKGRSSYLCLHRLEMARHSENLADRAMVAGLARIERWSTLTVSGDLAEMPELDEQSVLIPHVTSTRENCLGAQCSKYGVCHVNLARREALAADVVVINHHLFFADLAVRESGVAELLPTVRVVVFDEAHQLNEIGVQFLGLQLSTGQMLDFARDMLAAGRLFARGFADWQGLASAVEVVANAFQHGVGKTWPHGSRLRWIDDSSEAKSLRKSLEEAHRVFDRCICSLDALSDLAPDLIRLRERALELGRRAEIFSADHEPGVVRWIDVGVQVRLVQAPLDIAYTVQSRLLNLGRDESDRRAWIFTSATLGSDQALSWFTEPCGLTQATILKVESPFDYASQASVFVPRDLVLPNDPDHSAQVARFASAAARRLGGRTLLLTTTLRALRVIGDALQREFKGSEIEVLVQGEMPKRVLMERFRRADGRDRNGFILVASASFWEGVDIPGNALQLLIIDKLPFPPPTDPLVEARSRRMEEAGRSAFSDYLLPEASVALNQGAGRLIRRETDHGILAICDTRLVTKGYGRRLMSALPPMRRLQTDAEFWSALESLTRASTTAVIQT
jgi:ATP-dependent DNA helicase DinG